MAVALQLSGHLRRKCILEPTLAHVAHCRRRFEHCALFVHTWDVLEPATPHWRRGRRPLRRGMNSSSAECVSRLQEMLRPDALLVERQPSAPPPNAAAPDGTLFNASQATVRLHYGAEREFGWRMNVHGMTLAGRLRREGAAAATGGPSRFALSVRLRPDHRMRPTDVATFWDCVAALPRFVANQSHAALSLQGRLAVLGRARRAPGKELRERSRSLLWLAMSTCGQSGGLTSTGNDNCIVAPPRVLDDVLGQFATRESYAAVYALAAARGLPHNRPELQLTVAARRAGIALATACSREQIESAARNGRAKPVEA